MKSKQAQADILLLLTAAIWGFAFVAQRVGMDYVGPFTYGGVRFLLGALSLIPLILVFRLKGAGAQKKGGNLFSSALIAGLCLFVATSFQQTGIYWTTAGNSGFITGVYVVLVPIAGIFLGRKTGLFTWIGAALTFTGLFLVSGGGHVSSFNVGDLLIFVSGLFWTCHVLLIDHLVKKTDALALSCGQFAVCGVLSLITAAFNIPALIGMGSPPEIFTAGFRAAALLEAIVPVLYGGLASVGVAYTLQVVAQQWAHPAHASIILVLESVFAAIGGILLLGEKPSLITLAGFTLMLSGMIVSQLRREV
ncbi:MAG: DMT family transporter [Spirochaetaceae bacterium]|jgi:drug/metabolite transporter (DMT)-like permease|nr:DMT family transporter [Spirochaetaceae bacterium]